MGARPLEGEFITPEYIYISSSFKEQWANIQAMRITNKHLEPRGCDTIGETITDEKVRPR